MPKSLADMESLVLRCNSKQSREYIGEATKCYSAGAFRAAIVSTWIAVVFDLIDKVRELALSGDGAAKEIEKKYLKYLEQIEQGNQQGIKGALEFEREILKTSREKLEFFDQQQYTDLKRLRDDRHRCAHPSFHEVGITYSPSAEQARVHIRNAVEYVLSQPPVQGKAAVAEIIKMVSSKLFPVSVDDATIQLKTTGLGNPRESLVTNAVNSMLYGFLEVGGDLQYNLGALTALSAISQMFPQAYRQALHGSINKIFMGADDEDVGWAAVLVARLDGAYEGLGEAAKIRLRNLIEICTVEDVLKGLDELYQFEGLQPIIKRRIDSLEREELKEIIGGKRIAAIIKQRVLELLRTSISWDEVNATFSELVFPILEDLSREEIETIIRFPSNGESDLIGANAYPTFINRLREMETIPEAELNYLLTENRAAMLVPQSHVVDSGDVVSGKAEGEET